MVETPSIEDRLSALEERLEALSLALRAHSHELKDGSRTGLPVVVQGL